MHHFACLLRLTVWNLKVVQEQQMSIVFKDQAWEQDVVEHLAGLRSGSDRQCQVMLPSQYLPCPPLKKTHMPSQKGFRTRRRKPVAFWTQSNIWDHELCAVFWTRIGSTFLKTDPNERQCYCRLSLIMTSLFFKVCFLCS